MVSRKAAQYPSGSSTSPPVPMIPQQRDSSGIATSPSVGLGLGLSVRECKAPAKRTIGRVLEGRAMLAQLRALEREKESMESDSDSDDDIGEEVVTPTDEVTRMPLGMEKGSVVVDERTVFTFVCPAERA